MYDVSAHGVDERIINVHYQVIIITIIIKIIIIIIIFAGRPDSVKSVFVR